MKSLLLFLKSIVWADLFKHRYGLLVELYYSPYPDGNGNFIAAPAPVIASRPYKRPLCMPYNKFANSFRTQRTLFITGHKRHLKCLGNIGSVLPHNWVSPNYPGSVSNNDLNSLLAMATKVSNS